MRRRALLRACVAGALGRSAAGAATGRRTDAPHSRPDADRSDGQRPLANSVSPTDFEPAARLPLDDTYEAVTSDDGSLAFVAVENGFVIVDLSDPGDPTVGTRVNPALENHPDGQMRNVWDLSLDGDRLLVGAPGSYASDAFYGLALYDVSDPGDPDVLSTFATTESVHNCYLSGEYAYFTGDGLEIVHIERPEPERVATWEPADHDAAWADVDLGLRQLHDVWVGGDRAYCAFWDAGAFVLDVADPADPTYLGRAGERSLEELRTNPGDQQLAEPPGNAHYVQADDDGDLLAVGKEAWDSLADDGGPDDTGGPGGIDLWDVADPAHPTRLATIDPPPAADDGEDLWRTAHNFDLSGGVLYSAWYAGGVRVHDVSDPAAPRELARWRDHRLGYFWTAQAGVPGEYFVASSTDATDVSGSQNALFVFPDPTNLDGTPTPTASPTSTPPPTPTPTETPSPTPAPTATDTAPADRQTVTGTPAAPVAADATDPETTRGDGPGFGPLAALAGVGLGAWRLLGGAGRDGSADDSE